MTFLWTIRCKSCGEYFAYKESIGGGKTMEWKKADIDLGELICPFCSAAYRYSSNDMVRQEGEGYYE